MSVADRIHPLFTATAPARPLAVARIVVAAAALAKVPDVAPVVFAMFGGEPTLLAPYRDAAPAVTLSAARLLVGLWVVSGLAFLVGWRTRWAGAGLTLAVAAVMLLDQHLYSNHIYVLVLICLLLTVADSGAALSVDALRRGERDEVTAWPVTLLKIQLSVIYGFAVLMKLNVYYLSGAALNVYWVRHGLFALPDGLRRVEVLLPLALISLAAETLIAVGLWLPRVRHIAFVVGFGLHLNIAYTMGSLAPLAVFGALMFGLYILFLDAAPRSRLVVWDDACSFCRVWVRWLRRLDWLRVHRFAGSSDPMVLAAAGITTEEADTAIQLVGPAGRRASGFRAIRTILEFLPLSFLWAPILRIPPIERLGERVYAAVARRRKCAYPAPVRGVMSGTQHQ